MEIGGYGKCPVCGKPLFPEEALMGYGKPDDKGKQKKEPSPSFLLRVIAKPVESALFNVIALPRPNYVVCLNADCPLNSNTVPQYLKPAAVEMMQPTKRFDLGGIDMMIKQALYNRNKKKK